MPRYFFHIVHPGEAPIPDDEGEEFEDLEAARNEAALSLRDLVVDAIKAGRKVEGLAVEIMGEDGKPLLIVHARQTFS
jgi:hypothetical protein